jgi:Kef-type K+ transport system membrane component KefB
LVKVPNREAMAIGALMNARGLMELILLNIALQKNLITPVLFAMLALMAILTTLMASPLFEFVYGRFRPTEKSTQTATTDANISIASPQLDGSELTA